MSTKAVMIVFIPPFTLDKKWDNADMSKPSGYFWELNNYICKGGALVTREGVTALTYTPQTS